MTLFFLTSRRLVALGVLSGCVLCPQVRADEDDQNSTGATTSSQAISVTVTSSTTSDDDNGPPTQPQVRGKVMIMGPDGVRKEFDLADGINGIDLNPGHNAHGNPLAITVDPAEAAKPRPMLGIVTRPVSSLLRKHLKLGINGVVVAAVSDNLPAAKAGIQNEDIIVKADGKNITTQHDLSVVVREAADREFEIELLHEGTPTTVTVKSTMIAPHEIPLPLDRLHGPFPHQMLQGMGPGMQMPDHENLNQQMQLFIQRARDAASEARQRHHNARPPGQNNVKMELQELRKRMAELERRLEDAKTAGAE